MVCKNCGKELRDGAQFCRFCGTPVQTSFIDDSNTNLDTQPNNQKHFNGDIKNRAERRNRKKLPIIISSIAGVLVAAALIITIIFINNANQKPDYKKIFRVYKEELQEVKSEIDEYADHNDIDDGERKFVALNTVLDNNNPSLFYVTEGQDNYDNNFPVIKICEIQGDTAQSVFESSIDYVPLDFISILKNSHTGDTYLFADTEFPDGGNVAIYRLRKENNVILQDEMYRMTYEWAPDVSDGSYEYQYYFDKNSVGEEVYNNAIEDFIPTIDTIIISSNAEIGGQKYNYFKDIASVAMSYDEAIDYLDKGINEATIDEVVPKSETILEEKDYSEPTEATRIYDVDSSDLPESLTKFLQQFDFAYITGSSYDDKEFDCEDLDDCYDYLVNHIASNPTCVDGTLYPGGEEKKIWQANADPLGKFGNMATLEYPKEKLMWVMKNIFHINEDDAEDMLQAALDAIEDFYEYDKDGTTYLYRKIGGVGGPGFNISYETVRYDGDKYYFIYDATYGDAMNKNETAYEYYAEMAQEEIDGETYWTMYKHTSNIPALPKANTGELSDEEIFSMFKGNYTFTSGVGAWSTQLEINSDGSFKGEFHDTDAGVRGEGYDATLYLSRFSGRFKDPEKINSYTYSFRVEEINYENEPGTEEIGDPYGTLGDMKMLIKYSTAYGLRGSDTVYAYTASAPTAKLPEGFMSWVDHLRDKETRYHSELSYKCLYAVETEQGWIGEKE